MIERFYHCQCYHNTIWLSYSPDFKGEIDLCILERAHTTNKLSWFNRFRLIWQILTTGQTWSDDTCLDFQTAEKMANDLLDIIKYEKRTAVVA